MVAFANIHTPALMLDRERLCANAARMSERARALGVTLRPHVKTAKSIDVARILTEGWPGAIMVSTLAEAEYFNREGCEDIVYGVAISAGKFERAAGIARGCRLGLLVDSTEMATALGEFAGRTGARFDTYIEIDADGHRGGIRPDAPELVPIASLLSGAAGLHFRGVLTHAGEAYEARGADALERSAAGERDAVVIAATRLAQAGLACETVSLGSTPTANHASDLSGVTELRAGVYAFYDLVQAELGSCTINDIALSVLTTVIGHQPDRGRVLIDAGWMALSGDRGTASFPQDWFYGAVIDAVTGEHEPDLVVRAANQEHGIIEARKGKLDVCRFPLGSRLRILPNHACATAAAYPFYNVHCGQQIVAKWPRINGW